MTSTTSAEPSNFLLPPVEGVLVHADSQGRVRVSKEQRKVLLAKFEQSGMSAAKFAAAAGIKYSTFAGWVARYGRSLPRSKPKGLRWVEAIIGRAGSQPSTGLTVHLPGAVRIELSSLTEVPLAAALVEALHKRGLGC